MGSEGPRCPIEMLNDGLVGDAEFGGDLFGEDAGVQASENIHLSFGQVDGGVDRRTDPAGGRHRFSRGSIDESGMVPAGEQARKKSC